MKEVFYIFEIKGPYNWQVAEVIDGPYYNETVLIDKNGYKTESEAIDAIKNLSDNYYYGPYFIIKGYEP